MQINSGDDTQAAQAEVEALLVRVLGAERGTGPAEVVRTHANVVILGAAKALKMKRAVSLGYLDFGTLAAREAACRRELAVNRPNAPEIYRDVVPVTREADGQLALDGRGAPVEWVVRMARFPEQDVLRTIAEARGVDAALADDLARAVLAAHTRAEPVAVPDAAARMVGIAESVVAGLAVAARDAPRRAAEVAKMYERLRDRLARVGDLLQRRAEAGLVRRCHGDLHLGNIVLWRGVPTLFDAIEFDDNLATIDLLYDLAFLVMDLDRRGQRPAARIVLDRYLAESGRALDLDGLAALPAFLGLRAAIRAMVAFDRARSEPPSQRAGTEAHADETLAAALGYLEPPPPRLVAIGGLSGTGKTTLARLIAPDLLPAPGAVHVRSDVERKRLAGVGETVALPAEAYTADMRRCVYAEVSERTRRILAAGHSVVVDAVFAEPDIRAGFEQLALDAGVRFDGLWLEAPAGTLKARVAARVGDASDATPEVVARQLARDPGPLAWVRISSGEAPPAVHAAARAALAVTGTG